MDESEEYYAFEEDWDRNHDEEDDEGDCYYCCQVCGETQDEEHGGMCDNCGMANCLETVYV